jgi:phosphohistidine phosphatase
VARRLLLIRHAKTEQGQPDETRALTERGRRDAQALGRWLLEHDALPELAVISTARRARQTWDTATDELAADIPQRCDPRIYGNSVEDLLSTIEALDPAVGAVAIVGHNPSMHALANRWSAGVVDFPTCSIAVIELEGDWTSVSASSGKLVTFATCRDEGRHVG